MKTLTLSIFLAFAACSPQQQATVVNPATENAVATLGGLAAARNTTANNLVTQGQLFCKTSSGIVALLDAFAKTTSVIGLASEVVYAACATIAAIPVAPPANPAVVPVVVAPTQVL